MGKPERKARERICASSSYLFRCFGISHKIHSAKQTVDAGQEKTKTKTRTRWFLPPTKFRLKNDDVTLAPMYEPENQKSTVEDDKQNLFRVIRYVTDQNNTAAIEHETKEENMNEQRDINPDPLSFLGDNTCHEKMMTTAGGGKLDPTETVREKKSSRVRKGTRVDPVIGISIILVTLMIMLMWGRLCAILCTSVWCYFLPRLKEAATASAKRKRSGGRKAESGSFPVPCDLDLYSEAYKKKVVLEGFLVRQHRVSL